MQRQRKFWKDINVDFMKKKTIFKQKIIKGARPARVMWQVVWLYVLYMPKLLLAGSRNGEKIILLFLF